MDGVKQQIHAKQVQVIETKHLYQTRKLKRELKAELEKMSESNEEIIKRVKRDYNRAELELC